MNLKERKESIRNLVWERLEKEGVALFPKPIKGRIPNFKGAERAAINLTLQEEWRKAETIFVNPDSPQKYVRMLGLMQGKLLIMATPRLREGFLLLDPKKIPPASYEEASTIRGAFKFGKKIGLDLPKIQLKVTGSVAVDLRGGRLGKGHGYSDLEYGILGEVGAINSSTPVVTTVHELQIVEEIPREEHDMSVYLIATPKRVIKTGALGTPQIMWDKIDERLLSEIPLLRKLREEA